MINAFINQAANEQYSPLLPVSITRIINSSRIHFKLLMMSQQYCTGFTGLMSDLLSETAFLEMRKHQGNCLNLH